MRRPWELQVHTTALCLTKSVDSAGTWMHPEGCVKGLGGLSVKSEKRGIGSCVNESVMMLVLLILDTQLPSSFFSILLESLPVLAFWISASYLAKYPFVLPGPQCHFQEEACSGRVWREGREDRED